MRVRAIDTGYDNVLVREPGDEFDMPADAFGPWFEPIDPDDKARTAKLAEADAAKRAKERKDAERERGKG